MRHLHFFFFFGGGNEMRKRKEGREAYSCKASAVVDAKSMCASRYACAKRETDGSMAYCCGRRGFVVWNGEDSRPGCTNLKTKKMKKTVEIRVQVHNSGSDLTRGKARLVTKGARIMAARMVK